MIEAMKRPIESDYTSHVAYTRALEQYCDSLESQEPVAWMDADGNVSDNNDHQCFPIPLYTHPPQRTEQETVIKEVVVNADYREMWAEQVRLNQQLCSQISQPKREWIELTDDEADECACKAEVLAHSRNNAYAWDTAYLKEIQAKLKEKNS